MTENIAGQKFTADKFMTGWVSQSKNLWFKQFSVTLLAVLLSGTSCLLCCGPMEKSAAEAENCAVSLPVEDSAELCHKDDCCSENSGDTSSSTEVPCQDECCILNAPASELPATLKLHQFSAVLSPTVSSPSLALPVKNYKLPFLNQHLPEGQTIHLRCCVFLI
jgi:hypothetical protein